MKFIVQVGAGKYNDVKVNKTQEALSTKKAFYIPLVLKYKDLQMFSAK